MLNFIREENNNQNTGLGQTYHHLLKCRSYHILDLNVIVFCKLCNFFSSLIFTSFMLFLQLLRSSNLVKSGYLL